MCVSFLAILVSLRIDTHQDGGRILRVLFLFFYSFFVLAFLPLLSLFHCLLLRIEFLLEHTRTLTFLCFFRLLIFKCKDDAFSHSVLFIIVECFPSRYISTISSEEQDAEKQEPSTLPIDLFNFISDAEPNSSSINFLLLDHSFKQGK